MKSLGLVITSLSFLILAACQQQVVSKSVPTANSRAAIPPGAGIPGRPGIPSGPGGIIPGGPGGVIPGGPGGIIPGGPIGSLPVGPIGTNPGGPIGGNPDPVGPIEPTPVSSIPSGPGTNPDPSGPGPVLSVPTAPSQPTGPGGTAPVGPIAGGGTPVGGNPGGGLPPISSEPPTQIATGLPPGFTGGANIPQQTGLMPTGLGFAMARQEGNYLNGPAPTVLASNDLPNSAIQSDALQGNPVEVEPGIGVPLPLPRPAPNKSSQNISQAAPQKVSAPQEAPIQTEERSCRITSKKEATKKYLDILFVIDTSASMDSDRARVTEQMASFVASLDPNTDYRIAVMLAHGPKSPMFTQLYNMEKHSSKGLKDQAVLALSSFTEQEKKKAPSISEKEAQDRATIRIQELLTEKMKKVPVDHTVAQGEAGLLAIYSAVTNPKRLADIRAEGFFRTNAALAVFFISDENDVCYDYARLAKNGEKPQYKEKNGKKPSSEGRDPVEQISYDTFCKTGMGGRRVEPDGILKALQDFKAKDGHQLILSGALYQNNESIPRDFAHDKYADEKEQGLGYNDVIKMNDNWALDLAGNDFGKGMAEIGSKTAAKMRINNIVECDDLANVNPALLPSDSFTASIGGTAIPVDRVEAVKDASGKSKVRVVLNLEKMNTLVSESGTEIDLAWKQNSRAEKGSTGVVKFVRTKGTEASKGDSRASTKSDAKVDAKATTKSEAKAEAKSANKADIKKAAKEKKAAKARKAAAKAAKANDDKVKASDEKAAAKKAAAKAKKTSADEDAQ
jgi:hypothetical protein